ncbi:hypothetical protein [Fimbriiglobus ruber]|uniref:hypothetical protein n=1 Tax=Fimbriiglobus ruber TaxID=1908690 RepID=UPI000B4BD38D|nr:hypothetical protein [Fimbriiglobus ruber]
MRKFYILREDAADETLQWIVDYRKDDTDMSLSRECIKLDEAYLKNVKLYINNNHHADIIANPLGLSIVSKKLATLIYDFVAEDEVQILEVPIFLEGSNETTNEFCLLNPLRMFAALSPLSASERLVAHRTEIIANRIPDTVHIFRLEERTPFIITSDELVEHLKWKGLIGVTAMQIKTI